MATINIADSKIRKKIASILSKKIFTNKLKP